MQWDSLRGWQMFSIKGQVVNTLGFVSQAVSVAMTQVSSCNAKAATDTR